MLRTPALRQQHLTVLVRRFCLRRLCLLLLPLLLRHRHRMEGLLLLLLTTSLLLQVPLLLLLLLLCQLEGFLAVGGGGLCCSDRSGLRGSLLPGRFLSGCCLCGLAPLQCSFLPQSAVYRLGLNPPAANDSPFSPIDVQPTGYTWFAGLCSSLGSLRVLACSNDASDSVATKAVL